MIRFLLTHQMIHRVRIPASWEMMFQRTRYPSTLLQTMETLGQIRKVKFTASCSERSPNVSNTFLSITRHIKSFWIKLKIQTRSRTIALRLTLLTPLSSLESRQETRRPLSTLPLVWPTSPRFCTATPWLLLQMLLIS